MSSDQRIRKIALEVLYEAIKGTETSTTHKTGDSDEYSNYHFDGGQFSQNINKLIMKEKGQQTMEETAFGVRVAQWFDGRLITQNGTVDGQMSKLDEEVDELKDAIEVDDLEELKDAIGDIAVVLAGLAHMHGLTFEECCNHAWMQIKDRTGHLNDQGVFVKD